MDEFQAAFRAYRAAQARLNNAAAYMTLRWWQERVAPLRPTAAASLAADLTWLISGSRRLSKRLMVAYYQYARALDSGYQLGGTGSEELDGSLDGLRRNYLNVLNDVALLGESESDDTHEDLKRFEQELSRLDYLGEASNARSEAMGREPVDRAIQRFLDLQGEEARLAVEQFNWRADSSTRNLQRWVDDMLRRVAEDESSRAQRRLGDDASDKKLLSAHETVGQKVAGEVHSVTADAARKVSEWAASGDARVAAVARGTSMTPCGFCAMLASRGFTYRSVGAAMSGSVMGADGFRKVHNNCNCYPIIRWKNVSEQADLPQENKDFLELWNRVGNLPEFRKLMRERNEELIEQAGSQEE